MEATDPVAEKAKRAGREGRSPTYSDGVLESDSGNYRSVKRGDGQLHVNDGYVRKTAEVILVLDT